MATYIKNPVMITSAELRKRFSESRFRPRDPENNDRFPVWVWPYIRRAYLAGMLNQDFIVPENADSNDYTLPVLGFIKNAGIAFPGYELGELPEGYFAMVREAISSRVMDQYGKVDLDSLHRIPRPLWPYVRVTGRISEIVGRVAPDNPRDFPPGLIPYIKAIRVKGTGAGR